MSNAEKMTLQQYQGSLKRSFASARGAFTIAARAHVEGRSTTQAFRAAQARYRELRRFVSKALGGFVPPPSERPESLSDKLRFAQII